MLRFSRAVAAPALLLILLTSTEAQTIRIQFVPEPSSHPFRHSFLPAAPVVDIELPMPPLHIKRTGLLTSRLTPKQRLRWRSIEELVLARNRSGEYLHPVLAELWRWAEGSEHVIQIELIESKFLQTSTAGSFNIERFDPTGRSHISSLKLFLSSIDQAVSGPQVARHNGFIPFEKLDKEERYAEVLGHELAHVKYVLSNRLRAQLVHELVETTNDKLLLQARTQPQSLSSPEMQERLNRRDTLLRELEKQAEAIEEHVWHELVASKKVRAEIIATPIAKRRRYEYLRGNE